MLERAGTRIAALRKTRGWTARELARRASVSYSLLAKVESGAAPASPALIGAVARALRRSEEHTSELQSHLNIVFRLLLVKKNVRHARSPRRVSRLSRVLY